MCYVFRSQADYLYSTTGIMILRAIDALFDFFLGCFSIINFDSIKIQKECLINQIIMGCSQSSTNSAIIDMPNSAIKKLPALTRFVFVAQSDKILEGKHSIQGNPQKELPKIDPQDCFDEIGTLSLSYQGYSYTDGRYNNSNFRIQKGKLQEQVAYRIDPPLTKATQFLGSNHCLVYKFTQKTDHSVFIFKDDSFIKVLDLTGSQIKINEHTILTKCIISNIQQPTVYLFTKKNIRLSPYLKLNQSTEGALIHTDSNLKIQQVRYTLPEESKTWDSFTGGPNNYENLYAPNRDFFRLPGTEKIVWCSTAKKIYVSEFQPINYNIIHRQLESKQNCILGAASADTQFIYYTVVEPGDSKDLDSTRNMYLFKADLKTGKFVKKQPMPTQKATIDLFEFTRSNMVVKDGKIAITISRRMTRYTDGLNHQGQIATVFDANTLKLIKNFGQTSGHSLAEALIARKDKFCGIDLGDNYPRGINYWPFDSQKLTTKVVYAFKTEHGKQATSPAHQTYPLYAQISNSKDKFYKWSNDNKTYTELAAPGLIEFETSMTILFCGENKPNSLDSSMTGKYLNCSRNIGFVKVKKQIEQDIILSEGPQQEGGYYSFGGMWFKQTNKGIKWLTNFDNCISASRVKTCKFVDKIFVIFQCWSAENKYINTQYLIADENGQVKIKSTVIDFKIRLHRADDIYFDAHSNSIVIYSADKQNILNRYQIKQS